MKNNIYNKCLVLDQNYGARTIISSARAFVIFYKGNCEIVHNHPELFGVVDKELKIYKPSIIRINQYWGHAESVPLTRANILKRDGYRCVYCPPNVVNNVKFLTLDHVLPKSKGGKDSWNNLVTACKQCNGLKDDLMVEEFTKNVPNPKRPHYLMLLKSTKELAEEWKEYLYL